MKRTPQLSLEQISELYSRFQETGLSLAAFARQEKLPYPRIIYYKRRLTQAGLLPSSASNHSFLQIFPTSTPSSSQILLRCGPFELQLQDGFNPNCLEKLLEVLKHYA